MTVEEAKYSSREVSGLRPPPNPAQICEHVASLHKLNQGLGPALPGHSRPGLSLPAQVTSCTEHGSTESDGESGPHLPSGPLKRCRLKEHPRDSPRRQNTLGAGSRGHWDAVTHHMSRWKLAVSTSLNSLQGTRGCCYSSNKRMVNPPSTPKSPGHPVHPPREQSQGWGWITG